MSEEVAKQIKPLVTREVQHETNLETGKTETRLFIKVYFEARDSGLLADMPDELFKTLIVLGTHMDENGYCFPSQSLLAKELGIGRASVYRAPQEEVASKHRRQIQVTGQPWTLRNPVQLT